MAKQDSLCNWWVQNIVWGSICSELQQIIEWNFSTWCFVIIAAWTSQVFCLSNFILVSHDRKPCHVLQKVVVWEFDFKKSQRFNHQNASDHRPAMLSKFELCIKDILIWCTSNLASCSTHTRPKLSILHLCIPNIILKFLGLWSMMPQLLQDWLHATLELLWIPTFRWQIMLTTFANQPSSP